MITPWLFDIFNYPFDASPDRFDPQSLQELYDWHLESWEVAEQAGFEGLFFSEHHFTPYSVSPSPNLLIAAAAQRTTTMRLGVMGNIVPLHNPRRLAEEYAMLDYLSHGRLEIGIGRGVDEKEFGREGIPMAETRPRFEEGLRLIESMLYNPVFTHEGTYANYEPTTMWPPPLDRDRRRMWITALSPQTIQWCGTNGYNIATAFQPTAQLRAVNDAYKEAAKAAGQPHGPDSTMILRNVYVGETDEEARRIAEPALNRMFGLYKEAVMFQDLDHIPDGYDSQFYESFFRPFAGDGPVYWDALIDLGIFVVGSPDTVRESLIKQAQELGTSNILMWASFGSLTKEETLSSYRLLGEHVIPALREAEVV
ncbi:MAG: LLM class flavin-dependent oxidoreductase [Actinobacteria bacterium]|jgi:alkanesulfonate monooxygenase SsuD/methylene tetrahydromethanopterin reductase-like flavin-dependent oxidoreductase (luciferase family)|nr:LLM class flavin-dependent oxidoreductase [Actinomycetota bacterium]